MGWPIAMGAYKVILTEMEVGRVNWSNLQAIQTLRQQYAQRCISKAGASAGASGPPPPSGPHKGNGQKFVEKSGTMPCLAYQTKTCTFAHDHTQATVRYRHICAYCITATGRPFPHPESDCRRQKVPQGANAAPNV